VSERLAIARVGRWGDGISDTPGGPVYVPYALPGETVEVEQWPGHPDRRRLLEVETASPERIAPICPHFGICGGCTFQHWASARYREWKRALVIDALAQFGIESAVDDLIDAHGEGRRRAVFHARRGPHDLLEVGFAARKQHRVIAIDHCPILAPSLNGAVAAAWAIAEQIAGLAMRWRLPTLYFNKGPVKAGILMSYGPDILAASRRQAYFVDRILKGTKPADLPVEQPTKFELTINQQTAKALGLNVPESLLASADEVIE